MSTSGNWHRHSHSCGGWRCTVTTDWCTVMTGDHYTGWRNWSWFTVVRRSCVCYVSSAHNWHGWGYNAVRCRGLMSGVSGCHCGHCGCGTWMKWSCVRWHSFLPAWRSYGYGGNPSLAACAVCVDDVAGQLQSLQTLRLEASYLVQRGRRLTEEEATQTLTHIWPSATIHITDYKVTQCTEFTLSTSSCLWPVSCLANHQILPATST